MTQWMIQYQNQSLGKSELRYYFIRLTNNNNRKEKRKKNILFVFVSLLFVFFLMSGASFNFSRCYLMMGFWCWCKSVISAFLQFEQETILRLNFFPFWYISFNNVLHIITTWRCKMYDLCTVDERENGRNLERKEQIRKARIPLHSDWQLSAYNNISVCNIPCTQFDCIDILWRNIVLATFHATPWFDSSTYELATFLVVRTLGCNKCSCNIPRHTFLKGCLQH